MSRLTSADSNPDTGKIRGGLQRLGKSAKIGEEERLLKTAKGEIYSAEDNNKGVKTVSFDQLPAGCIICIAFQNCLCSGKRMGN